MKGKQYEVICGDVVDSLRRRFNDNVVDLIVTSPPYNIGMQYGDYGDRMVWSDYYRWTRTWLEECLRILKPDGRMVIWHYFSLGSVEYGRSTPLMHINEMALYMGFRHHAVVFWADDTISRRTAWGSWLKASAPYINSPYEGGLILYKEHWKKLEKGKSTISRDEFMEGTLGIWRIPPDKDNPHPAPFPVALADRCIQLLSYRNDLVVDPFVGSGTTLVAALRARRRCVGIDANPDYCKMAIARAGEVAGA